MHVPEKLDRLIRETRRVQGIQDHLCDLQDSIVLDLIDGWTTGDRLVDFALVACNGIYDESIINGQYRAFQDLVLGNPHRRLLVVQEAEHLFDFEMYIIRNVYVTELRVDPLVFDIDLQLMSIPVDSGYLVWREILRDGVTTSMSAFVPGTFLQVGPLENDFCPFGTCHQSPDGAVLVPPIASCMVYPHPWNQEYIEQRHGIDAALFRHLVREWVTRKTRALKAL
jgi:hypothetical protein